MAQIQWFPGHMAKTRRLITENLKLVDIAVEILDARIPISSKNPMIDEILNQKPRLLLLNKSDIADESINNAWVQHYKEKGVAAMLFSAISPQGNQALLQKTRELLKNKIQRQQQRGIVNRPIKIMVVGVPNVGKSAFINCLSGRKSMKVENRPGVTRDKQWIKLKGGFELLDTPGILWPKFEDKQAGFHLAFCGSIKDDIMDTVEIAILLLGFLKDNYPSHLTQRYNIELSQDDDGLAVFEKIGKKRGFMASGGQIDEQRTSNMVLDEFRSAKIGRVSLETPEGSA